MLNLIKFMAVAFVLLAGNQAYAATGCIYQSSGYIYQTRDGNDMGYPNYAYMPRVLSSAVYCVDVSTSLCRIDDAVWGYVVTYSTVNNCPIDDYVGLMLVVAGGVGVFFLRKRILPVASM
ncbi:hypothetical protein VRU48_08370 [Pedobacter sp. KR3-3]|uniref:Uncharacterized protein n=1 Tax=Pedobacter albus TaxID=3113905 RepID=A0ABU7I6L8_9SPHI|nr:hypothetical protein [Pedobacter sp. KR3-3]MEE1945119.1 hypothetical protein [Pedobacter sp. KR3-3]